MNVDESDGAKSEVERSTKLGNVWGFVQLIFGACLSTNQLCTKPNMRLLTTSRQSREQRGRAKFR